MPPNYDREKHKGIVHTMATCHSLKVVDGELLGDPLEVKMFQFTGWSYEEGENHTLEQSNMRFGTIAPSVVRPPVGAQNVNGNGQQSARVILFFFFFFFWEGDVPFWACVGIGLITLFVFTTDSI